MPRFFRLSLLSVALSSALVAFTASAPSAYATCAYGCKAKVLFADCTEPSMSTLPSGTPLTFTMSCQSCCGAPGPPKVTCYQHAVDLSALAIWDANFDSVAGTFSAENLQCNNTRMFSFDGQLAPGHYYLKDDSNLDIPSPMTIAQFDVVDPAMGTGGAGGVGGMGGGGSGGAGAMGASSSSSSGSAAQAPGHVGNASASNSGCSIGRNSSGTQATGWAMAALALVRIAARRRRS